MQVSTSLGLQGARVIRKIGRITATSAWHGQNCASQNASRDQALAALIAKAKDFEADAIIGVDFAVDDARVLDLTSIPVERTAATGIAVKIAKN